MPIIEYWTDGPLLKEALEHAPGMVIRLEEWYPADTTTKFVFWAEGDDFAQFEAGLDADPTVTEIRALTETPTRRLYRVTIAEQAADTAMVAEIQELDIIRLDSEATHEGWRSRLWIPDQEALAQFQRIHQDRSFPFELQRIYYQMDPPTTIENQLTDKQREALITAYEAGHFDVPQKASQSDVADQLGIAPQSLSELLQRGTGDLIEATLIS